MARASENGACCTITCSKAGAGYYSVKQDLLLSATRQTIEGFVWQVSELAALASWEAAATDPASAAPIALAARAAARLAVSSARAEALALACAQILSLSRQEALPRSWRERALGDDINSAMCGVSRLCMEVLGLHARRRSHPIAEC